MKPNLKENTSVFDYPWLLQVWLVFPPMFSYAIKNVKEIPVDLISVLLEHKVTESQNMLSWKQPTRIIESNSFSCTEQPQESPHVFESIVQTLPELCQAWDCDSFHWEPVSVPKHPQGEESFS